MPEINESTAREAYTIAGETFNVFQPFTEGHVLTSGEASSLNQTFAENVRNNFAAKVKEAKDTGSFDLQVFQGQLDDYMAEYEFGVRRGGGGRTTDPVQAEAMNIARNKVREAIRKAGLNLTDYTAATISEKAKEVLAKYPEITEQARAIVQAASELVLDIDVSGTANEEAPAKGRKAKDAA